MISLCCTLDNSDHPSSELSVADWLRLCEEFRHSDLCMENALLYIHINLVCGHATGLPGFTQRTHCLHLDNKYNLFLGCKMLEDEKKVS